MDHLPLEHVQRVVEGLQIDLLPSVGLDLSYIL